MRPFFLALLFFSLLGLRSANAAETAANPELEGILQKIESRHYRWIGIRADVLLFFAKGGNTNAMCGGELLYQRLDERMFLTCVDTHQKLTFIFRTLDRRFDLYLPAQNTVYHGSIFDMEDSPDIESHLKARDLYRALKPMAVDPRRAKIERTSSAITSLDVYGRNESEGKIVRKLYLTPEGDVRGELFYDPKGRSVTEIQRYDFREIPARMGSYRSVIFPKKVTIMTPETKKGSAIFFSRVTPLDTVNPLDFMLRTPPGTKDIFLDERDPRFQPSKTSQEKPITTVPPKREIPVYLAKPIEVPIPAKKAAPVKKKNAEKETPAKETPLKETPSETPKVQEAVSAPVATVTAAVSPDADLAVENTPANPPASPSDAQTTLDPSVEPSLDMGKQ